MGRLIDADPLYERTAEWEAQALAEVNKYDPRENREEWQKWTYILNERSAFKHDVADAPTVGAVEVVRCEDCKHNPTKEWFGCPMAHLTEEQRPEDAWCWKGEKDEAET